MKTFKTYKQAKEEARYLSCENENIQYHVLEDSKNKIFFIEEVSFIEFDNIAICSTFLNSKEI